uniref:MarR family transcriptional regulator n=1 Tax=Haemonchus placei TaxID=6290 RepID=A0A0N4X7M0_HAEPC
LDSIIRSFFEFSSRTNCSRIAGLTDRQNKDMIELFLFIAEQVDGAHI